MNKHFTTSKGTQLPLLNLRGKEYLEVKYRLVWFREEHPDWSIETSFLLTGEESATAKAIIRDETGRIIATSHKAETVSGFPDFLEKAETGAIGRALALIGYGTQFCAEELDEGPRLVDSPVLRPVFGSNARAPEAVEALSAAAGSEEAREMGADKRGGYHFDKYRIAFGKYRGKRLVDVSRKDLEGYLGWLREQAEKKNSALSAEASILERMAQLYYEQLDRKDEPTSEEEVLPQAS